MIQAFVPLKASIFNSMNPSSIEETSRNNRVLGSLAIAFVILAIIFALVPHGSGIPIPEPAEVSAEDISIKPRFTAMGDDAQTEIEGFKRNCMDCHELIDSQPRSQDLLQHEDIHMAHGLNARCVNCHDPKNRDKLTLRDGKQVGFSQSPMLCAQCHGTTYREWERGVHGKTLGYWDASKGKANKLGCVQCHDPHSPRYEPMAPLPAPNTLRMGDQPNVTPHNIHGKHSPLSRSSDHSNEPQNPQSSGH